MTKDFKLPDLGEGVHEGQIVRVMVKVGDDVREDQPLMEVETDKAAVVIPSPYSGVVQKVHVKDGQMVHVGDVMVSFGDSGQARSPGPATSVASRTPPAPAPAMRGASSIATHAKPQAASPVQRRTPASPAVRKLARTMGIDLESISGSGPGGRVQRADLERAAGSVSPSLEGGGQGVGAAHVVREFARSVARPTHPPAPSLSGRGGTAHPVAARVNYPSLPESISTDPPQGEDSSDQHGPIRFVPLTQARKTIASVMAQAWSTIPHATDFEDADVTELDRLRRGYTAPDNPHRKLTMLAFVVRAIARALQRFPAFNAHFDEGRGAAVYKRYMNIAIGVHTPRGLVPMVIRNADQLSIPQISDELFIIGEKARSATFAVNDTRGGTYTISNAGAAGGSRYSTPIITPGQAAVLALGQIRWMPWVIEGDPGGGPEHRGLAPRLILPLSHSIDHRLLDGGDEIQFMQHVIGDLQNPARLLL